MSKKELLLNINKVHKIASASKMSRMLNHPIKYISAIFFREILYKRSLKEKEVTSETFFNEKMHLLLPSSTDIYLTKGKSHSSEIRLAKYLINNLESGDTFVDVGAHYGYFTLLASKLVGELGKVFSFEASPTTYRILGKNCSSFKNIFPNNVAVSDSNNDVIFHEFPNLFSEYNSLDVDQFKEEKWFQNYKPLKVEAKGLRLGDFMTEQKIAPKIIKIDVEGAEFKVLSGTKEFLKDNSTYIVLEYLSDARGNSEHIKASELLTSLGYKSFSIDGNGDIELVESLPAYFSQNKIDSDNIVFKK